MIHIKLLLRKYIKNRKCFQILDDTYMYDDAARGALGRNNQGHWYDEPPYESDPDDFLMSGMGPAATIQVCNCNYCILVAVCISRV